MIFTDTDLEGVKLIELDKHEDNRGFFSRAFCKDEFSSVGLNNNFVQMNTSFSKHKGTIRGLHFQYHPHQEIKMVRCFSGKIWDVVVDIRPKANTFGKWQSFELSADNRLLLYIPKGFAHGFQTLTDDVELLYWHSESYKPSSEGGILFNDPDLAIPWPLKNNIMSERDLQFPRLLNIKQKLNNYEL